MKLSKKIAAAVSALMILQSASIVPVSTAAAEAQNEPIIIYEENGYYMGDLNDSSEVSSADLVLLQSHLIGRSIGDDVHLLRGDMDHDGGVDIFDMILLRKTLAGSLDLEYIEKQQSEDIEYTPVTADVSGAVSADITLSGTPYAGINGAVGFWADNNWNTSEYSGTLDSSGNYTFNFEIPDGVDSIQIEIYWSGIWDSSISDTVMQNAAVSDVELNIAPLTTTEYTTTIQTTTTTTGTEPTTTPSGTTTQKPAAGNLIVSPMKAFNNSTPTTGDVKMLAIYVDFADATYLSSAYSNAQIEEELFGSGNAAYPYESVTAWYERASYGNLHIDGDVYRYTCSGNMSDYSSGGFEKMAMEVLKGLDSQINYADYDGDKDGIVDCIAFTVPLDNASDEMKNYWYGCTATWYDNADFKVDSTALHNYIIMDVMPNQNDMPYLKQTLIHEMGHSMGLPDYYKYNSSDWEGLHGDAGYERMDDSIADFSSFSKLMLGWLRDDEVQAYTGTGSQTFLLDDASNTGSCLILPISSSAEDYTSEYFLVEYITKSGNNSDMYTNDTGIRVFHVQAETNIDTYWQTGSFKYDNFSSDYLGDDKIRVLRLVNDNGGFSHTGDMITYGTSDFAAYDSNGDQTIDTGYTISIGSLTDGKYSVTVSKN